MISDDLVHITAGPVLLEGVLALPDSPIGVVLFAHGSGSSRHSPRNNFVASTLRKAGIGTLLFDLLTRDEDRIYENRFDIDLLTLRLTLATRWLQDDPRTARLPLGYFGASTGSAAALRAAADLGAAIRAVVSRGGRPDLAGPALNRVLAPTLLIVGGLDDVVIALNQEALQAMTCEKSMVIVPGATHLFEEPGTLEEVERLASEWFAGHMSAANAL